MALGMNGITVRLAVERVFGLRGMRTQGSIASALDLFAPSMPCRAAVALSPSQTTPAPIDHLR
jgi:hypothetical protein